jgi:hypothetical protein
MFLLSTLVQFILNGARCVARCKLSGHMGGVFPTAIASERFEPPPNNLPVVQKDITFYFGESCVEISFAFLSAPLPNLPKDEVERIN